MDVIDRIDVGAYVIPTATPESDGTLEWDSTTLVLVEVEAGGVRGLGYTYADVATALLIKNRLAGVVHGRGAMDIAGAWEAMVRAVRNLGRPGISSMAISAIDNALWDLKAHLLRVPVVTLLGGVRDQIPVYGSGGFTSYSLEQLQRQLAGWVTDGISRVKMKVGRQTSADPERVRAARQAIGPSAQLFVDANGAYPPRLALSQAARFADFDVNWFEEPVSSDDLEGLRFLREHVPAPMAITAGEYGYDLPYFRRMLEAGAVDVVQPDATRCAGITGFIQVAALCAAAGVPLSAHTAPSLHVHVCCAVGPAVHVEYFFDHARIEEMLFDGFTAPKDGALRPDLSRPGFGLELKRQDAVRYAA
jgi:L-alanine-DL-glutamate epimerase-like enolase superfamily enzyme